MKHIKKFKDLGLFIGFIMIYSFILTILNSIFTITDQINNILSLTGLSIYILIYNIKKGKHIDNKAYLYGLKNGFKFIIALIILSIIFQSFSFKTQKILYYIILIIISITGAIIGINKKKI